MKPLALFLTGAALLATLACGGGGGGGGTITLPASTTPATKLVYTSPTDPTAWRLVQDSASTNSRLVLDLLAPTGTSGQGVTLVLTSDTALATWAKVDGTNYADQVIYTSPKAAVASVSGSSLQLLYGQAFQAGAAVNYGITPVLQVALNLASSAVTGTVALTTAQGGHLGTTSTPTAITVSVGALQAE